MKKLKGPQILSQTLMNLTNVSACADQSCIISIIIVIVYHDSLALASHLHKLEKALATHTRAHTLLPERCG